MFESVEMSDLSKSRNFLSCSVMAGNNEAVSDDSDDSYASCIEGELEGESETEDTDNDVSWMKYLSDMLPSWGLSREVAGEQLAEKRATTKRQAVAEEVLAGLEELRKLDRGRHNFVAFIGHAIDDGRLVLKFEKTDMNLCDLMEKFYFDTLSVSEIRVVVRQLLVFLDTLKSIKQIETDIKPDNITLVNHETHLKFYRTTEVTFIYPLNGAINIWSLGCLIAFLFVGMKSSAATSRDEDITSITQMVSLPDDHLSDARAFSFAYFSKQPNPKTNWTFDITLRDPTTELNKDNFTGKCRRVNEILMAQKVTSKAERADAKEFLKFLKLMLQVDPKKRITLSQALEHDFITMKHFPRGSKEKYVISALKTMKDYQPEQTPVVCTPSAMPGEVEPLNGPNGSCSGKPCPSEREATAEGEKGQPAANVSDKTSAACNDGEFAGTDDAAPSGAVIPKEPTKIKETSIDGAGENLQDAPAAGPGKESDTQETVEASNVKVGSEGTEGAVSSNSSVTPAENAGTKKVSRWGRCLRNIWATMTCRKNNAVE